MVTPEQVFNIASMVAGVQWLLLIFVPNSKLNSWLMRFAVVPLFLSVIYCVYIIDSFSIADGGYGSIKQVRALFSHDRLLLAGWVHYLAFDLLIGFSLTREATARQLSRWLVIPCLFLTFMFGPVGFLTFQIIKKIKK
jgi:hypothetical protein